MHFIDIKTDFSSIHDISIKILIIEALYCLRTKRKNVEEKNVNKCIVFYDIVACEMSFQSQILIGI